LTIAKGGRMMIHDAQVIGHGLARRDARVRRPRRCREQRHRSLYAERAGGKPAAWRKAMQATTTYSAQQAVDAGLADRISNDSKASGPDNRTRLIQARHRALATQGG
jgi:ATP-dependent protease ClpP protease subunit